MNTEKNGKKTYGYDELHENKNDWWASFVCFFFNFIIHMMRMINPKFFIFFNLFLFCFYCSQTYSNHIWQSMKWMNWFKTKTKTIVTMLTFCFDTMFLLVYPIDLIWPPIPYDLERINIFVFQNFFPMSVKRLKMQKKNW